MSRKGVAGQRRQTPPAWQWAIDDYLHAPPANATPHACCAATNSDTWPAASDARRKMSPRKCWFGWFGQQAWSCEHRRSNRSAARGFFSWAYRHRRVPVYLGDALPAMRQPSSSPRPAPDDAWAAAVAAADARTRLMLRLAAEAGLRRAEVAQVNTRDVFISRGRSAVDGARQGRQTAHRANQ
jgi:integrase